MTSTVHDQLLSDLADRCCVRDAKVLRKSKELIHLLNSKRSINCSDTCKLLICLELAACLTSVSFSRDTSVRLSGCSKRNYVNHYNNISKLLNVDKVHTLKEICLLTGATQICDDAASLLNIYKSSSGLDSNVLQHPMYMCAAILAVSYSEQSPVNLAKLVDLSRIKKVNLKKLSEDFQKFYKRKTVTILKDNETISASETKVFSQNNYCREKEEEMSDEKYNDWKRKMLEDD